MLISSHSNPLTKRRLRRESDTRMNASIAAVDRVLPALRGGLHLRQRRETLCVCQCPLLGIMGMVGARQQFAMLEERVDFGEAFGVAWRNPFENMDGPELARTRTPGGAHQLAQGRERALVKLAHPNRLVVDDESPLAPQILGGHAGRATIGMTGLRLDAAQRKHEAAGGIA